MFSDVSKFTIEMTIDSHFWPLCVVNAGLNISINVEGSTTKIVCASIDTILDVQSCLDDPNVVVVCRLSLLHNLHVLGQGDVMFRKDSS